MKTRPFNTHSVLLRVNLDDITLLSPLSLHSSLNQMEVRPHQIFSLMLTVSSQFLPPKVPSTLAFALSLGICSGSGRQRLGSHSLALSKRGIGVGTRNDPKPSTIKVSLPDHSLFKSPFSPVNSKFSQIRLIPNGSIVLSLNCQ